MEELGVTKQSTLSSWKMTVKKKNEGSDERLQKLEETPHRQINAGGDYPKLQWNHYLDVLSAILPSEPKLKKPSDKALLRTSSRVSVISLPLLLNPSLFEVS